MIHAWSADRQIDWLRYCGDGCRRGGAARGRHSPPERQIVVLTVQRRMQSLERATVALSVVRYADHVANTIVILRAFRQSLVGGELISASMKRRRTYGGRIRKDF